MGVDASPGADAALGWAFDEVALRGGALEVVAVYAGCGEPTDELTAMEPRHQLARQEAVNTLEHALEEHADAVKAAVEVKPIVLDDSPAHWLIRQAEGADLLVVGAPAHGVITGWVLGSVCEHCVHHAPCPVVVVPPSTNESD